MKHMESITCVHYGHSSFNRHAFCPIKNNNWIKPSGGLWATPIDSEFGWREWCKAEDFNLESLQTKFEFVVRGYILKIDSVSDLQKMKWVGREYIDFEAMLRSKVDAIWLTAKGQIETRWSSPSLYGWDCESVLILNPKSVLI